MSSLSSEIRKLRLRMTKDDKNFIARTNKNLEKSIWVDGFLYKLDSMRRYGGSDLM